MAIYYDPKDMLRKIAPESKVKRMISRRLDLKRAALSFIDAITFLDKKKVTEVALKTAKSYKDRMSKAAEGSRESGRDLEKDLSKNPRQLIQRVQNEVVLQISSEIRSKYGDEFAEWLPSDAEEPDPEHQLNYGKVFKISEGIRGEIPGERIGCRCGMRILVKQSQLSLG